MVGVGDSIPPLTAGTTCSRWMKAERAFQHWKQGRAWSAGLLATIHSRAREICGILSCTSMHFRHLAATAVCPEVEKSDTWPRQTALIMPGSRVRVPPFPPLCKIATNMRPCSVLPRDPSRPVCRLPWIHLTLRRLRLLTQGVRRGAHGANEPRSIAKLAGCDGDGSREEGGKSPSDSLIQLGTHADASPEDDELQIEERLQCHYGEGHPARRRVEDRRRHFVAFLQEPENVAHSDGRGSTLAAVSIERWRANPPRARMCRWWTGPAKSDRAR